MDYSDKKINRYLKRIVNESFRDLGMLEADERDRQEDLEDDLRGLSKSGNKSEVDEAEEQGDKKTPVDPGEKKAAVEEISDASIDDVIIKLNVMRSGQSLKDKEVKDSLKDYWGALDAGERQTMYVFLDGLAQIMAGGAEGSEPANPGELGIRVKAKREEPAADRRSKGDSPKQEPDEAPIVVGEKADKSKELRILRENR